MPAKSFLLAVLCCFVSLAHSQNDSLKTKKIEVRFGSPENLQLNNNQMLRGLDSLLHPELRIGGYVSTYYAHYDDEIENNNFVQFPTLAPRNNQFALNMALISFDYQSQDIRGTISLHYGDIPESSWPATFNLIQEAHAGFKIVKKLWLDAGFFKTHIGLGSFQPRENITSSMSIPDFYDPYYLSGAKLTYYLNSKLSLQACIFNGYNTYIDHNKNKALDFTASYSPNSHWNMTYNFLTCDETPDAVKTKHQRYYQNFYATFQKGRWTWGADLNFGLQQHTLRKDSTKMASMYAATLVGKYNFTKQYAIYARGETFSDPNDMLTGVLDIGDYIHGITAGMELKPYKNMALSAEWRILEAQRKIFFHDQRFHNQRNEIILCLDLWF
jgi:hypothetical protein